MDQDETCISVLPCIVPMQRRLLNTSDAKECGQDMCAVTDTSSYIHSLRHRVVKDVGEVLPIKLLHKTEAFQDKWDVPAMMDEEECGGSSCIHPEGEMW